MHVSSVKKAENNNNNNNKTEKLADVQYSSLMLELLKKIKDGLVTENNFII